MNFYSPVSNTNCHSIGHKMRIARIKIRVDSPGRWGIRSLGRECNFEEVCFELGLEYWQRRRVSSVRGSEFQSRGPMTEKALLPSDDRTYGMERTNESEDLVETVCDGNERLC